MHELVPVAGLAVAMLLDWRFGDLPNRFHPVVAMGHWIALTRRHGLRVHSPAVRCIVGSISLLFGIIACAGVGWVIEELLNQTPMLVAISIQAAALKTTFSIRSLATAANSVALALQGSNLPLARQQLAFHLVSRDTSELDENSVAAAAIESVAENTSDSFIAPLFYYAIAGLPGALVYRYVNTCDAMLGYRSLELEWIGKPAARCDDLLNLIPSRLTALLMLLVGPARKTTPGNARNRRAAISIWLRDHRLTSSPNAGHPMSAAAGLLGVMLEKREHYRLGEGQLLPNWTSINAVNSLLYRTSMAGALVAFAWLICGPVFIHGV